MVGDYLALFQHQLQLSKVLYVSQWVVGDHYQVGQLARLHGAQLAAHAAELGGVLGRGGQRLPGKHFSSNRGPYLTQAMLYSDSHETMDLAFIKNRKETDA